MTAPPTPPPVERVNDLERILAEMRRGVREALLRHKQAGQPVAVWRDGRVHWVRPEDIPVDTDDVEPTEPIEPTER